jgi:hypothetical protein
VVAVGEAPAVALNRVEAAARETRYAVERKDDSVVLGAPVVDDHLVVTAVEMDVGTRVELRGDIQPEVTNRILRAMAKSRPWTSAPAWDDPA